MSLPDILPFQYPSPIDGCDCIVCTRRLAGVNPGISHHPPSVFEMYSVQSTQQAQAFVPTAEELADFDIRAGNKVDFINSSDTDIRLLPWYKICSTILKSLLKDKDSRLFKTPVDWVKVNLAEYPKWVKHPMDLGTIDRRMHGETIQYDNPEDFVSDVRLVFINAFVFNPEGHSVRKLAEGLSLNFETQLAAQHHSSLQ